MRLNTIPISDYRQSIEPVDFFEPGDRYAGAPDEPDEFMDYHEDEEREWTDKHEEDQ